MMTRLKRFLWALQALMAARTVQDYLWGTVATGVRPNKSYSDWVGVIERRAGMLYGIDPSNPSWRVMARKRLLQTAAISMSMIEWIDQLPEDYNGT